MPGAGPAARGARSRRRLRPFPAPAIPGPAPRYDPAMTRRVTLSDVARAAGVSLATASRAVNGSTTRVVRPDLRDRVLASAEELGYTPDANAQAMARGRTTSVGLVVHDIADPYYAAIAAGVATEADRRGLLVSLADTRSDAAHEVEIVEMLDRQRAVAIVLAGTRFGDPAEEQALIRAFAGYRRRGGSVATVAQSLPDLPAVGIDNAGAAAELTRRLVELGYRRFALVAGPPHHSTAAERIAAIRSELARLGLPVPDHLVASAALTRDGGRAAAAELLSRPDRPEIIMASTDLMAVGVLGAARDAGLRLPEDLAVTGFDDVDVASDVTPRLTTVRLPLGRIGRLAIGLALGDEDPEGRLVPGEVIVRESTPSRA